MELFLSRAYQFNWISCLFVIGIVFIERLPVQLNKLSIRYCCFYQETTSSISCLLLLELFLSRDYQFNWISCLFVIGIVFIKRLPVQLNKLSIRYWNCFYQETTSSIEWKLSCLFVIGIVFIKRLPVQLNKLSIRYWNCFYQETTSSIE